MGDITLKELLREYSKAVEIGARLRQELDDAQAKIKRLLDYRELLKGKDSAIEVAEATYEYIDKLKRERDEARQEAAKNLRALRSQIAGTREIREQYGARPSESYRDFIDRIATGRK